VLVKEILLKISRCSLVIANSVEIVPRIVSLYFMEWSQSHPRSFHIVDDRELQNVVVPQHIMLMQFTLRYGYTLTDTWTHAG